MLTFSVSSFLSNLEKLWMSEEGLEREECWEVELEVPYMWKVLAVLLCYLNIWLGVGELMIGVGMEIRKYCLN